MWAPMEGKEFSVYPLGCSDQDKKNICGAIKNELDNNRKVIMFCQSASLLENIMLTLENSIDMDKCKIYVGDKKGSQYATTGIEKRNDMMNVNTSWKECDFVAFTGTICVGVDFNEKHFDTIIGVYTGDLGLTPDLFVQGLLRARQINGKKHILFVSKTSNISEKKISFIPLTSQRYYAQTRNTIISQCQKLDIFGHQKTGLRCLLGSRNSLMYYYAQDYIFHCLNSLGFGLKIEDYPDNKEIDFSKSTKKIIKGVSRNEIEYILRSIEKKRNDPYAIWEESESNINKLMHLGYGIKNNKNNSGSIEESEEEEPYSFNESQLQRFCALGEEDSKYQNKFIKELEKLQWKESKNLLGDLISQPEDIKFVCQKFPKKSFYRAADYMNDFIKYQEENTEYYGCSEDDKKITLAFQNIGRMCCMYWTEIKKGNEVLIPMHRIKLDYVVKNHLGQFEYQPVGALIKKLIPYREYTQRCENNHNNNALPENWVPKSPEEEKALKGEDLKHYKKYKSIYERINNIDKVLKAINEKFESKKIFNSPREGIELKLNIRGQYAWMKAMGVSEAWVME